MFRTVTRLAVVTAFLILGLSACTVRIPLSTGGPAATPTPEGLADANVTATPAFSSAGEAYRRGRALLQKGDLKAAAGAYSDAITLDPNYVNAYLERGTTYRRLGNFENALSDLNRAAQHTHRPSEIQRRVCFDLANQTPTPKSAGWVAGALLDLCGPTFGRH